MLIEHGKIDGNLMLDDEAAIHGMVTGDIVVRNGGVLYLHGFCCKNLIIQEGAKVYLHGTVAGDVHNINGILEVYGTVIGHLRKEKGSTTVSEFVRIGE